MSKLYTIKDKVLALLGENNSTYINNIANLGQLWEESIWEIANALPTRLMSNHVPATIQPVSPLSTGSEDTTSTPINIGDDELPLMIIRTERLTDGAGAVKKWIRKPCKLITLDESYKAQDEDSIYFATATSPVYWKAANNDGQLQIVVAPSAAGSTGLETLAENGSCVEYFKYIKERVGESGTSPAAWEQSTTYAVGTSVTYGGYTWECIQAHTTPADDTQIPTLTKNTKWAISYDTMDSFEGIPEVAEELVVKRIAHRIIEQKISNTATQDEDQEIYQLLKDLNTNLVKDMGTSLQDLRQQWNEEA